MKEILIRLMRRGLLSGISREPASFADVERAERIFYLQYLRDGMTVFDVGANVGELTLLFSRFVPTGTVHSFEASQSTFDRLERLGEAAQLSNVVLNRLALSDEIGTIQLNVYDERISSFNTQADRPMKNYGIDVVPAAVVQVPATTVDDYCDRNNIERIDLLKIDVEGAELRVMRGAKRMLAAGKISCLTFEFGQTTFDMGDTPEAIEAFLKSHGYEIHNIVKGDPTFPGRGGVETARYSMHVARPTHAR